MRRNVIVGIVALFVAVGLGAVSLAANAATPEANDAPRFDIKFHDTFVTKDPNALALGDRIILSDAVLKNGEQVGHNGGVCTVTDVAGEMECTVTWSLPDGTISTQFLNTPPPEKTFAIVGGTGHYAGARGTGTLVEHGDETGTVAFALED
jgi:hypothetical protein